MSKAEPFINHSNTADLSLSALLSQLLVAFTVEFDNEFEHRMLHQNAADRLQVSLRERPWLVSMVMWYNCLRFVTDQPIPVSELEALTLTTTNLDGMRRWGYVFIETAAGDSRIKPPKSALFIRATSAGIKAKSIIKPLTAIIESRWQERFGKEKMGALAQLLQTLVQQFNIDLPDCMPILGFGLYSRNIEYVRPITKKPLTQQLSTPVLLSKALQFFAIEFEKEAQLSLAISANVLRVLDEYGVPLKNLPVLSGVSKEAISMAIGILTKYQLVIVETDPIIGSSKLFRLTTKGIKAQYIYLELINAIELNWRARFGNELIANLYKTLNEIIGSAGPLSPLFQGISPYPDGWRASIKKPLILPYFPMVLHRGGYPDGS